MKSIKYPRTTNNNELFFKRSNYILLLAGILFIIIGFALMSEGNKMTAEFDPEIYNFRRICMAPVICVVGFTTIIYGIMRK